MNDIHPSRPFKVCGKCGFVWETVEQFVLDKQVRVTSYRAVLSKAEDGVYVFTHETSGCWFDFVMTVESFASIYDGPRGLELKFMNPECDGHCFLEKDLEPCKVDCSMRWPREILQYLREHRLPRLPRK